MFFRMCSEEEWSPELMQRSFNGEAGSGKFCVSTLCRLKMHISKLGNLKNPILEEIPLYSRFQWNHQDFFLSNAYLNIPFTIIFQILKMIYLFNPVESFLGVNHYDATKIYKLCPYIQISRMMR